MGTSIAWSGSGMSASRQQIPRLRHRCIEDLHHGSDTHKVSDVLHGVPQDPRLRPRLNESLGPPPAGLFFVGVVGVVGVVVVVFDAY